MTTENSKGKPQWLVSQLRDRHTCEHCASRTATTEWAGTGELLCWPCCEARVAAYHAERGISND